MLTSAEAAYATYLEHRVVADGVDASIVRATLQQMGFDEATVASMMGDAGAYASIFSSSSSSSSSAPCASLGRLRDEGSRMSAASSFSAPSAPSAVAAAVPTPVRHKATPASARTSASPGTPEPPSIIRENGGGSSGGSTALSLPSATSSSSSTTSSAPVPSHVPAARTAAGHGDSASDVERGSDGSAAARTDTESSVHETNTERRRSRTTTSTTATLASQGWSPAPSSESTTVSCAAGTELTAAEHAVLRLWAREYKALLLSSALPRRAAQHPHTHASSRVRQDSSRGTPPSAAACGAQRDTAAHADLGVERLSATAGLGRGPRCAVDDSDASVGDEDGATSSTSSAVAHTDGGCSAISSEVPLHSGVGAVGQVRDGECDVAVRRCRRAGLQRFCRTGAAATPSPTRRTVPAAPSAAFIPTCGSGPQRRTVCCHRCDANAAQGRRPYREAQDIRIARAGHAAVVARDEAWPARSLCRARQLDADLQAQHTAQALPRSGRRVPVMHDPVGPSVRPRAGLPSGRLASTLPGHARTDRVQLVQCYRHQWEHQDRRSTTATRDAVWNTRYALLSCGD
ncbi:hypothetical protein NESM_000476800 [Novymonas esmeraldas]|uniref:Uncharacterized protein n=1 Tax=Novymonas esmeraldas TaxID=1808958 RepID=A0AAW0EQH5_9TRYP